MLRYDTLCYFCKLLSIFCNASFSQLCSENQLEGISEIHKGPFSFFSTLMGVSLSFPTESSFVMELQVHGQEPVALLLRFFQIFYTFVFLPITQFIFQASGTTKLLLKSPNKNNVPILHLLNIYALGHRCAEAQ